MQQNTVIEDEAGRLVNGYLERDEWRVGLCLCEVEAQPCQATMAAARAKNYAVQKSQHFPVGSTSDCVG